MCLYIQSANYNIQKQPGQHFYLSGGMASISSWCIFNNVQIFKFFDRDCKIYFGCMFMHTVFELNDKISALNYVIRHSKYLESPHFYPKKATLNCNKKESAASEWKSHSIQFHHFTWFYHYLHYSYVFILFIYLIHIIIHHSFACIIIIYLPNRFKEDHLGKNMVKKCQTWYVQVGQINYPSF